MKKKLSPLFLFLVFLSLSACSSLTTYDPVIESEEAETPEANTSENDGDEITLNFSFGTRTGIYSGEVNEDGLPDGYGKFTSENPEGDGWTYEGDWVAGHWEGTGTSTWFDGEVYRGEYKNDVASGYGTLNFSDGSSFEGNFTDTYDATGSYEEDGSRFYAEMIDGTVYLGGIWRTGGFGDELDAFQGRWHSLNGYDGFVVINGESINIVTETEINGRRFRDIKMFYFGHGENGELIVVDEDNTPTHNISINSDNILSIISDSHDASYEKFSDDISLPEQLKDPEIGMTSMDIHASTWGSPSRINTTTTAYGKREQWVYDFGYIYFEDGIVTAIQEW